VSASLTSIAASPSLLVAVGAGGTILTSAYGTTWTSRKSGTDVDLAHVIFNGEEFVAVGGAWCVQAVALTSSDGTTWTRLEAPPHYSFHAVAFAGGRVFAAAETPSKKLPMALDNVVLEYVLPSTSSPAGWLDRNLPRFSDSLIAEDQTLTVGNWSGEATLSSSSDGQTWSTQVLPGSEARAIASSGSEFIIVGGRMVLSSSNGVDWSEPAPLLDQGWLSAVAYGESSFVAVGSGGAILTSSHGSMWTKQAADTTTDLADTAYGPE
jgi:hypothetical protein